MNPPFTQVFARVRFVRALGMMALLGSSAVPLACGSAKRGNAMASVVGTGHPRDGGGRVDAASAGQLGDDGGFDHTIYSGARYLCGYDKQDVLEFPGNTSFTEVAIATDERGFALVHHDEPGNLWIEALPIDGQAQAPVTLLDANQGARSVALTANGLHFLLSWRTSENGAENFFVRELSTQDHAKNQLTTKLVSSTNGGELSALLALDAGFIAAFIEHSNGGDELRLQRIDLDGNTQGDAVTLTGVGARAPEDLHLARLDSGGMLVAWVERDAQGSGHVMSLALGADLHAHGDPVALSKNAVHDARFDLAARRQSEGLIYHAMDGDVRDAIKYRRVDPQGLASEAVLNIVNAPGRARDGSIAAFGQGYAVAYRELPSLGVDHPAVHIAFVNQFGEVVHEAELGTTTETGGRTTVSATSDGHLLVGWTSAQPSSATTHALKLYCPGALILCGGALK